MLAPAVVRAQSIYKCPLPGGGFQYTDVACAGPRATVVHKATAGEVAAKLNADARQAIASMLRNNRVEDAKRYAVAHHQESLYNSIVNSLVREQAVAEQRREQQAALEQQQRAQAVQDRIQGLAAQNENLQQQVNAQSQQLELQRQRASQARRQARSAQDAAINAQNAARQAQMDAETPKFNPQTKQWCQQIGGTVQCH
jgi:hypothetical protein